MFGKRLLILTTHLFSDLLFKCLDLMLATPSLYIKEMRFILFIISLISLFWAIFLSSIPGKHLWWISVWASTYEHNICFFFSWNHILSSYIFVFSLFKNIHALCVPKASNPTKHHCARTVLSYFSYNFIQSPAFLGLIYQLVYFCLSLKIWVL